MYGNGPLDDNYDDNYEPPTISLKELQKEKDVIKIDTKTISYVTRV